MEKIVATILTKKGLGIGLLAGILLAMKSIKEGTFRWSIAIPNIIGAIIMGYISYEIGKDNLNGYFNMGWTFFMSINSFFIINLISEPEIVNKIFTKFIGINTEQGKKKQ